MTARITIDGNLVADPDFGVGDNGTSWAHLRVASHERIKRDGEWISTDPEFYNITLFGEPAEQAANELHKGDRVTLAGRPQLETFDRRDGTTGSAIKVYTRAVSKTDARDTTTDPGVERDTTVDPGRTQSQPTVHHTPEATSVVDVGKSASALHKTLKDNGFRWSSASTSWNLPTDMDEHTRSARLSELLSTVRANGRDLTVVNEPMPTASSRPGATAGAAPSATGARYLAGRSL